MTIPLVTAFLLMQAASPAPAPKPCSAPEHRQLDFWVGDWDVFLPDGRLAGRNTITREFGGCVVQEHWTGVKGLQGSSFNVYEPASGRWHQTWVDSSGTLLLLDGRRDGEAIVLEGDLPGAGGGRARHVLRLEPRADGGVHQLWRTSGDGGKTWSVVFDGVYKPHKPAATD